MRLRFILSLLLSLIPFGLSATEELDLFYSAGTVTPNQTGDPWAYLAWQTTGAEPPSGPFALYKKPGGLDSPAPYKRIAVVQPIYDPTVIKPILARSQNLGEDLGQLRETAERLFLDILGGSSFPLEELLSVVFMSAEHDPELRSNLVLLARLHPSVALCLGWGYAIPLNSGETTFEIRRYNLETAQSIAVIGRVTLDSSQNYLLPPPGPPVNVTLDDSRGHLNVRLRWGTDPALRRLGPLHHGYNVYRVTKLAGASLPTPATVGELMDLGPDAVRVNRLPILASADFTPAEAAITGPDLNAEIFFFADDNNRFNGGVDFADGDRFFYFVTARDILGRDGLVSAGTEVLICSRMPPPAPSHLEARNRRIDVNGGATGALEISWRQNPDVPDNSEDTPTHGYHVYRWTSLGEMHDRADDPNFNRIGFVAHEPGQERAAFLDSGPGAPTVENDAGFTFLYTVRAEDSASCGENGNLSGNSAPIPAVLRDWSGPDRPQGVVFIDCSEVTMEEGVPFFESFPATIDQDYIHFILYIVIKDPLIEWYEAGGGSSAVKALESVERRYVDSGSSDDYKIQFFYFRERTADFEGTQMHLTLQAGSSTGAVSERLTFSQNIPKYPGEGYVIPVAIDHQWVKSDGSGPCRTHVSRNPRPAAGQTDINPIEISWEMPPDAAEWKLFRRVNDGPMSLVGQGAGRNLAGLLMTTFDRAMPAAASARICYFLQVFNVNGGSSGLASLGCYDVQHDGFPRPLLSPIIPGGSPTAVTRSARLRFFTPPFGVERFEVWVGGLPNNTPAIISSDLTPDLSNGGVVPPPTLESVEDRSFRVFETRRVGGTFGGQAPVFEIDIELPVGGNYAILVRPVGPGPWQVGDEGGTARVAGPFSNVEFFEWTDPVDENAVNVPWPALSSPPVHADFHPSASARILPLAAGGGVGFRVGEFTVPPEFDEGVRPSEKSPKQINFLPNGVDPQLILYRARSPRMYGSNAAEAARALLPGVLYRYQISSGNSQAVSQRIVQVSPMVSPAIKFHQQLFGAAPLRLLLNPFLQVARDADGSFVENPVYGLYLRDTHPVISGATYGYVLVLFNEDGEIDRVIPSEPVTIPSS